MTGEEEIVFQPAKRPCVYVRQRRKKVVFAISSFVLGQCYKEIRHAVANPGSRNMKQSFRGTRPRIWFKHEEPDLLEMTGDEFVDQFTGLCGLNYRGFVVVIRMMWEVELTWMTPAQRNRWRHILLPLWAELVAYDKNYLANSKVKEMFTSEVWGYDLRCCRMIMAPRRDREQYWTLYAIDMSECIVHVLDPRDSCIGEERLLEKHSGICEKLITGLGKCAREFCKGWEVVPEKFTYKCHEELHGPADIDESAFDMVHYFKYFDGKSLVNGRSKEWNKQLKGNVLQMVLGMKGNKGCPPKGVLAPEV
ncbi:uncharacterized protein LOC119333927 [Triticum dicoccoides]|uniref:uncharacterized protein LOC119333927 n=1 Tax=Triticum dicoccoides TaxID=85692 RepID=UPI001890D2F1|nr:uncharacterized protein LOC119333927 [Triticum dicoccoides]